MREDPVRALRAVRFAARLGFTIEPDCFEAMRRHAGELARCAPPRLLEETFKILRCGGASRAFELLRACGALPVILPALGAALEGADDVRRRSFFAHLTSLDRLVRSGEEVSEAVLLGALLGHLGPESENLLASLVQTSRLPRKIAERTKLALNLQRGIREPQKRRRRRGGGSPHQADALQLLRITVEATGEGREALERWNAGGPPAAGQAEDRERGSHRHAEPGHGQGRGEHAHGGHGRARGGHRHAEGAAPAPAGDEVVVAAAGADERPGEPEAEGGIRTVTVSGQPAADSPEGAGRRRRRRRGGRRRRRRGGGAPAGGGAPPAGA
jgi:poly(A) polymerase